MIRWVSNSARAPRELHLTHLRAGQLRYAVFRDLWANGHYLSPASKFGGDYLAYPGDPVRYHAHYVVMVLAEQASIAPHDLVSIGRLAVTVKKTPVYASVDPSTGRPFYTSVTWEGVS